jgi:hypothetical protein
VIAWVACCPTGTLEQGVRWAKACPADDGERALTPTLSQREREQLIPTLFRRQRE